MMPQAADVLRETMRRYRRDGARLAAMVLLAAPERIGDEPISDFLRRIEYIGLQRVASWLANAGAIHAFTPTSQLTEHQRRLIAAQLVAYSKTPAKVTTPIRRPLVDARDISSLKAAA